MSQWVKTLATKSSEPELISRTNMVEEQNQLLQVSCPLTPTHLPWHKHKEGEEGGRRERGERKNK